MSLTVNIYYTGKNGNARKFAEEMTSSGLVEQIRGVDSAYSVAALLNKKLIEEAGRLNVPGRPIQYRTTPDFLRTFGLSSLEELPPIEKINFGEPIELPQEQPAGEEG